MGFLASFPRKQLVSMLNHIEGLYIIKDADLTDSLSKMPEDIQAKLVHEVVQQLQLATQS